MTEAVRAVPLTSAHVEAEIARLSARLETVTLEYAVLARRAAEAEVAHKVAYAKAIFRADGRSADQREAEATINTEQELHDRKLAEALSDANREMQRTYRTQLEALRTLAASLREQT